MTKYDYSIYDEMTKGEWLVDPDNITMVVKLVNGAYRLIVDTEDGSLNLSTDEEEANARAIASLPSLIKHAKEADQLLEQMAEALEHANKVFNILVGAKSNNCNIQVAFAHCIQAEIKTRKALQQYREKKDG